MDMLTINIVPPNRNGSQQKKPFATFQYTFADLFLFIEKLFKAKVT